MCDDDNIIVERISNIITKQMMQNSIEYKIIKFYDYNNNFIKYISNGITRIYILDIETPTRSGIDAARIIRNYSIDSVIIFLTGHQELGFLLLNEEFNFLTFINKFDNSEKRLRSSIQKSLQLLNIKRRIRFEDSGIIYTISLNDIIYIERDTVKRKCLIVTSTVKYYLNKNLSEIKKMLDDRFIYSHRSCIVNTARITSINKRKNIIIFDNETRINLLSSNYKKELCNNVNTNH